MKHLFLLTAACGLACLDLAAAAPAPPPNEPAAAKWDAASGDPPRSRSLSRPTAVRSRPTRKAIPCLDQADYKGPIIIEYESGNQQAGVKKCVDYLKAFIES